MVAACHGVTTSVLRALGSTVSVFSVCVRVCMCVCVCVCLSVYAVCLACERRMFGYLYITMEAIQITTNRSDNESYNDDPTQTIDRRLGDTGFRLLTPKRR